MRFLFDFLPILLFFVVFKFYPDFVNAEDSLCLASYCIQGGKDGAIYAATFTAIIASFLQVAAFWWQNKRFETMHLVTLALILVLGSATIYFQNELFIKWKPTLVNWAFAIAFFGSQIFGKKTLIQRMMEKNIELDSIDTWKRLNSIWVMFFIFSGLLNIYVAFNFSTDTWVNFKLFGLMGLTVIFVFAQAIYLTKHIVEEKNEG
jgi:intracellular septation protein